MTTTSYATASVAVEQPAGGSVTVGVIDAIASETAVRWGADEAGARGTGLALVHVWAWQRVVPCGTARDDDVTEAFRRSSMAVLEDCRHLALRAGAAGVTVDSLDDSPVDALARAAANASTLVLGERHLRLADRLLVGGRWPEPAAESRCPIVIARRSAADGAVVVGIDHHRDDGRLLDYAFGYAERHGLPVRIVHGWHSPLPMRTTDVPHHVHVEVSEYVSRWRDDAPDVPVSFRITTDAPVDVLLAESADAALLVVGTPHGHPHLPGHSGALTRTLVYRSACSVAVIPAGRAL